MPIDLAVDRQTHGVTGVNRDSAAFVLRDWQTEAEDWTGYSRVSQAPFCQPPHGTSQELEKEKKRWFLQRLGQFTSKTEVSQPGFLGRSQDFSPHQPPESLPPSSFLTNLLKPQ
jgi:hypothetical protein